MNIKALLPLGLASVLGLGALVVGQRMMSKPAESADGAVGMTKIVVAAKDIPAGAAIADTDLRLGGVASDSIPGGSFTNMELAKGRIAKVNFTPGQAIAENMLAEQGEGKGLQSMIPPGMRAITIEINEFSGLAGMVLPGCRVDVLVTLPGEAGDSLSRPIVQNILVKAVGTRVVPNQDRGEGEVLRSVTLVGTPKEVAAVELAAATARPRLVLRSGRDGEIIEGGTATVAELRGKFRDNVDPFARATTDNVADTAAGGTAVSGTAKEEKRPFGRRTIKVIKGGVESEVSVESPAPRMPDVVVESPMGSATSK